MVWARSLSISPLRHTFESTMGLLHFFLEAVARAVEGEPTEGYHLWGTDFLRFIDGVHRALGISIDNPPPSSTVPCTNGR